VGGRGWCLEAGFKCLTKLELQKCFLFFFLWFKVKIVSIAAQNRFRECYELILCVLAPFPCQLLYFKKKKGSWRSCLSHLKFNGRAFQQREEKMAMFTALIIIQITPHRHLVSESKLAPPPPSTWALPSPHTLRIQPQLNGWDIVH